MRFARLAALLCAAAPVWATTYNFTFFGSEVSPNNSAFIATLDGFGSFSSNISPVLNPIHASDLTSFFAEATFNTGHGPGSATWDFGLGDLNSFTYEESGSALPPLFMLTTNSIDSVRDYIYPTSLVIAGLGPNQVTASLGVATITGIGAVPEPSTFLLIGAVGLPFMFLGVRSSVNRG